MTDVFTVIVILLLTIALLITNLYIIVYFSHPDDRGSIEGWILKILVLIGFTLSWLQVIMLPLDVSNNRTFGGGLNMKVFWYIIYLLSIIYILLVSRIAICIYESDDTWTLKEILMHSFGCSLIVFLFILVITIILYNSIGTSEIPITVITCNYTQGVFDSNYALGGNNTSNCNVNDDKKMSIDVNFIIYLIAIMLFCSWPLFAVFGGIGLVSVPIDFFYGFASRPKHMKSHEISQRRSKLLKEVEELKLLGENIKNLEAKGINRKFRCDSQRKDYDVKFHKFKAGCMLVDKEFHIVNAAQEARKKGNCVFICYYLLLPLGIICLIMTILWLIQFSCSFFSIKNRRPGYPFLAYLYIFLQDHDVAFLSFFFFAFFALYLLFCTIKGNFKFGVRFLCCWDVYSMKKEGTYMDSFIFNTSLVLFTSFAIIHFCAECFTDYVAFTDIDIIFNQQIRYLKFFKYFFNYHIFQYLMIIVFIISLIFLILKPEDDVIVKNNLNLSTNSSGDNNNNNITNATMNTGNNISNSS